MIFMFFIGNDHEHLFIECFIKPLLLSPFNLEKYSNASAYILLRDLYRNIIISKSDLWGPIEDLNQ